MVLRGHRFNLVIETTAVCCPEVSNVLGLLNKLYVFSQVISVIPHFWKPMRTDLSQEATDVHCAHATVTTTIQCYGSILHALELMVSTGAEHATV